MARWRAFDSEAGAQLTAARRLGKSKIFVGIGSGCFYEIDLEAGVQTRRAGECGDSGKSERTSTR